MKIRVDERETPYFPRDEPAICGVTFNPKAASIVHKMAENGEDIEMNEDELLSGGDDTGDGSVNGYAEDHQKLIDYGIDKIVAAELIKIYKTEKLLPSDLDSRALDALKEFNSDDAIQVLKNFCESNLEHVGNKSAFLCGQMKTFRQMSKQGGTTTSGKGPDEAKLKEILDRTGYSLDVTTGQRKYGGPPPDMDPTPPGAGHEIFCGKIPRDIYEDVLIPLFEKCGKIWDLRLMMDPTKGQNRGYCFVTFCEKDGAREAVTQLDNYEIRKGKFLKVNVSVANLRLFVGNIPKSKTKDEIKDEFGKRTEGLVKVIIYGVADNPKLQNRGFAFLEYDSHKSASTAKRKLGAGRTRVWNCDIIVDWADPQSEPEEEVMDKVKVLYVRNLTSDVTEEALKEKFEEHGKVERVKKIKDYGFVHFEERDQAIKAMDALNGKQLGGRNIEVSLAKPPTENKKKEQRKREQEGRKMMYMMNPRGGPPYGGGWDEYWGPPPRYSAPPMPPRGPMRGGGGRFHPPPPPPRGFGGGDPFYEEFYDDDYYFGGYAAGPMRGGRPRGAGPPPPMRGRGAAPRGATRGGGPGPRGAAGGAGGPPVRGHPPSRGAGMRGARGGSQVRPSQPLRGKRKAGGDFSQGISKRRNVQDPWGNQPIAQQPLDQPSYGGNSDAEWYQDSYGQNWG